MILDTNLKPHQPHCPDRSQEAVRIAQARSASPAQLRSAPHARCLAPGARTPPGVLAPGASPRVRWSHRGLPQHRK